MHRVASTSLISFFFACNLVKWLSDLIDAGLSSHRFCAAFEACGGGRGSAVRALVINSFAGRLVRYAIM